MLILPPEADESVVSGALDRITNVVGEPGGEVGNVDRWGRRRLAYRIERQSEGYYVVVQFTSEPDVLSELDRSLHLADEVVRFKIVVRDEAAAITRSESFPLPGTPSTGSGHQRKVMEMASDNQVTIVGNLTDDPELRYTPNGAAVVKFRVAVNRRYKDESGQWKDGDTSYFSVSAWRSSPRTPPSRSPGAPASS